MSHLMGAAVAAEPAELDGSFCWWDHDGEPLQPSPVRPATPDPGPTEPSVKPSLAGGAGGVEPPGSAAPALQARQGAGGLAGSDHGLGLGSMLRQGPGGAAGAGSAAGKGLGSSTAGQTAR